MGQQQKPNATPGEQGDDQDEVSFSQKQIDAINSVVTSQVKRALKDVPTIASLSQLLDEKLKTATPATKPEADDRDDKGRFAKTQEKDPAVAKMLAEVDDLKKKYQQAAEQAASERLARLQEKTQGDIKTALVAAKVKPEFVDLLARDMMRLVKIDADSGAVTMAGKKPSAIKGLPAEDIEEVPSVVLGHWSKTEEARAYIAATPLPGNGGKQPARGNAPQIQSGNAQQQPDSIDAAVKRTMNQLAEAGIDPGSLNKTI
jgi:hypothetical protein